MSTAPIPIFGVGIAGASLARCLLAKGIQFIPYWPAAQIKAPPANDYGITLRRSCYHPLLQYCGIEEEVFIAAVNGVKLHKSGNFASIRARHGNVERFLRKPFEDRLTPSSPISSTKPDRKACVEAIGELIDPGKRAAIHKDLGELHVEPFVVWHASYAVSKAVYQQHYDPHIKDHRVSFMDVKCGSKQDVRLFIEIKPSTQSEYKSRLTLSRPTTTEVAAEDSLFLPDWNRNSTQARTDALPLLYEELHRLTEVEDLPEPFKHAIAQVTSEAKTKVVNWHMRTFTLPKSVTDELNERKVAAIGATAHTEPILGGSGANEAMMDAVALARHIEQHGLEELHLFYDAQRPRWEAGTANSLERLYAMHNMTFVPPAEGAML